MSERRIILDLCGGTGAWSRPYAEAGYDVRLVTLPEQDVRTYQPPNGVHGILAAPPCTMFSLARTTASTPRDTRSAMDVVSACLQIIWECTHRDIAGVRWWAMENPRGLLRRWMGYPTFMYEQWQFGDRGIKPTDLWGVFKEPRITIHGRPEGLSKCYPNGRLNAEGWSKSAVKRAVTPPGFARAFFEANP